jgi:hypothetical protein
MLHTDHVIKNRISLSLNRLVVTKIQRYLTYQLKLHGGESLRNGSACACRIFFEKPVGKNHLEDLGIDGDKIKTNLQDL